MKFRYTSIIGREVSASKLFVIDLINYQSTITSVFSWVWKNQTLSNPSNQSAKFYIIVSQSEFKVKIGKEKQDQISIFSFASDSLRRWCEFSGPATEQS